MKFQFIIKLILDTLINSIEKISTIKFEYHKLCLIGWIQVKYVIQNEFRTTLVIIIDFINQLMINTLIVFLHRPKERNQILKMQKLINFHVKFNSKR